MAKDKEHKYMYVTDDIDSLRMANRRKLKVNSSWIIEQKICRVKPEMEYLWAMNCRMSCFHVRQTKMQTWVNMRGRGQE